MYFCRSNFIILKRLIIDIGNTFTKMAVFSDDRLLDLQRFDSLNLDLLKELSKQHPDLSASILSAVKDYPETIDQWLSRRYHHLVMSRDLLFPFKNEYRTPETLGKDRMALAAGAVKKFQGENVLVIDAGTTITYDLITEDKRYLGGGISPGLQMRFRALNTFTGKLPLINEIKAVPLIGKDTRTSILSGVLNGTVYEMEGIIRAYSDRFDKLKVVITGGDQLYFVKKLKNSIFAAPNLVLEGLNEILILNEGV